MTPRKPITEPAVAVHKPKCMIDGCDSTSLQRGWCSFHYRRWVKYDDPLFVPKPAPTKAAHHKLWMKLALLYEGQECLPWPFVRSNNGYGRICIDGRMQIVSRVMCSIIHGEPPTPEHDAAHSCGKGHEGCINPKHLSWKTKAENCADKEIHGRVYRGEDHYLSVLTEKLVFEIRISEAPIRAWERTLGVSYNAICQARNGATWKHVKTEVGQ